jgi:hypothetical protein
MLGVLFAIFLVLHGVVHMLYFGQSQRYFELQPGMTWPDESWAFSSIFGTDPLRFLASTILVVIAIGFAAGGAGIFLSKSWWRPIAVGAAILSSIAYVVFWDATFTHLDNQGFVGIFINQVLLAAILVVQKPSFAF